MPRPIQDPGHDFLSYPLYAICVVTYIKDDLKNWKFNVIKWWQHILSEYGTIWWPIYVPYRIKSSKSSSQELSLTDKGGFIKNYLTMLIMEAMQWYSLRENGFNRPASIFLKKEEEKKRNSIAKRMKKELHFSEIFRKPAWISIALFWMGIGGLSLWCLPHRLGMKATFLR